MLLTTSLSESWTVFFPIDSKEQKLIIQSLLYILSFTRVKGPLFFNIYICDMFFDIIEYDTASYADDNAPYNFDFSLDNVT